MLKKILAPFLSLLIAANIQAAPGLMDENSTFSNTMKREGREPVSTFWAPVATYLLPGLGQFRNGQELPGLLYATTGLVGLGIGGTASQELSLVEEDVNSEVDSRDSRVRRLTFGFKTYDFAGSMSAYHYFHTVVTERKKLGEYEFLPDKRETTLDLMQAPFAFSNITRWTTWVPLLVATGGLIAAGANDDYPTVGPTGSDVAYLSGISYYAGVGEEALFRGWMFPWLVESYGLENFFWANLTQSTVFGLAHLSPSNPAPVAQTLLGLYFGWLAQKNNWSLQESIFVHTWWDIIVFSYAFSQGDKRASIYVPLYQTQF